MEEKINKASAPKAENEGVYHLQLKKGDVPSYVILPGAPERTLKIAKNWDNVKEVASYGGDISHFVPQQMIERIYAKYGIQC